MANRSSDTKQGEGWWMASDRRWYPPELHPSYNKDDAAAAPAQAAAAAATTKDAATAAATTDTATAKTDAAAGESGAGEIAIKQATPTPNTQAKPQAAVAAANAAVDVDSDDEDEDEEPGNPNFVAGVFAAAGAIFTMLGSLLTWAKSTGMNAPEIAPFSTSFSGFDSSGKGAMFIAVFMLIFAALLIRGQSPSWIFGVGAFLCGALITGIVLYSYFDITGKASTSWQVALANNTELSVADVQQIGAGLGSSFGLWITALGGLLGLLTPPFLRRDVVVDTEE